MRNSRRNIVMIMNLRSDEMSGDCSNFRVRHPCCIDRITSISKMQSDTTFNIYIAERFFYIARLKNYVFRSLYLPSSGCTVSYYKANYTVHNVFDFVDDISFTLIAVLTAELTHTHTHTYIYIYI